MIKSDFDQKMPDSPTRVHFIGIGGAGMSGIARLFLAQQLIVSGSDLRDSDTVTALREAGATVALGHSERALGDVDVVVVSGAITEDNPEYLLARKRGIPTVHRAVALAWLTEKHRLVAIAGAHGKTTSTAMIVTALQHLGRDPGFVNGGVIRSLGISAAPGTDEIFVVEADESDGSFLLYSTAIVLITNVDPDHLDHFGTPEAFKNAFVDFAMKATECAVISADDPGAVEIAAQIRSKKVVTFGTSASAMVRLHSIEEGPTVSFAISWNSQEFATTLRVPGRHNALNAAGAFGTLMALGFDPAAALSALSVFEGTERRFELRGEVGGIRVYDDFAHHPTEVLAALTGARSVVGGGRIIPIFQPHLYSRTQRLAGDFAEVFERYADHTIVVPIYPARESPIPGVTGELIAERFTVRSSGEYVPSWADAIEAAVSIAEPGDIVMPMGGGDVCGLIPDLIAALERKALTRSESAPPPNPTRRS